MAKPKIAYHTITWDMAGDLATGVREIAELGFQGWEVLDRSTVSQDWARRHFVFGDVRPNPFQSDTTYLGWWSTLSRLQQTYGIPLTSVYFSGEWGSEHLREQELGAAEGVARLLRGMGASVLVVAGGLTRPGGNSARDYGVVGETLNELARRCNAFGMRLVYHPHLDTMVETREHLDAFAAATDPTLVGLCLDPAHLVVRGEDIVDIYRTYVDRVWYTHFKDVKGDRVTELIGPARYTTFAELGQGVIDFPAITRILLDAGYDGWITVELDATTRTPIESARISKQYLEEVLNLEV